MAKKNVLLFIENSRAYGRGLLRGIAKYAKIHGSWYFSTRPQPYSQPRTFQDLENFRDLLKDADKTALDGVITRELPPSLMQEMAQLDIPIIVIPYLEEYPQGLTHRIITDSTGIGEMAAQYFIEKGFKHFGYSGYDPFFWSQTRKLAFGNYVQEGGFSFNVYDSKKATGSSNWISEKEDLAAWLKELPKPIAILTCTDDRGLQLLEACEYASLKVPEEVAVVGVDNDHLVCDLSNVAMSSIDLTTEQAGYEAAELLSRLMDGEEIEEANIKVFPRRVVTRQSSDILAINDTTVAKAMEFIRENTRKNIKVNDVVAATWTSRRVLELKFKKTLGASIAEEIRRQKVDKICELLTETRLSVKQIAEITGFETSKHIARYFSREKGMNLLEYRKVLSNPVPQQ